MTLEVQKSQRAGILSVLYRERPTVNKAMSFIKFNTKRLELC